ncbi:MAG: NACHT domain-containing protein [Anaerolineae bacterium]
MLRRSEPGELVSQEFLRLYWEALYIREWADELERAGRERRIPLLPARIHRPFAALNAPISIVRQVLGVSATTSPAGAEPLRVLVVHCNSEQRPVERLQDLLSAFLEAVEPLRTDGLIECPDEFILCTPTPQRVLETIETVNPHVLVTMCHGKRKRFGTQMDGLFVLSDGEDGEDFLYARQIAETLQAMDDPQLRVAFMPHCRTMAAAPALLAAGVPAAVAMQELIADHVVTVHLVNQLFRSLAGFKSLDECLIDVRERLVGAFGEGNPHWCFPTLWLASEDSRLFASREAVQRGQYLREVLRTHRQLRVFGHQEEVPLERHYIEAGTQREVEKRQPAEMEGHRATREQPVPDWLEAHERVMRRFEDVDVFKMLTDAKTQPTQKRYYIWGSPGAGKTTALKHLVTRFAEAALQGPGRIPVFIELHALGEWLQRHGDDPNTALLTFIAQQLQPLPGATGLLAKGDAVLFLDGMDEVLEKVRLNGRDIALRQRVCQSLTWLAHEFHQCPIVITSRLRESPRELSGFSVLEMKPFDEPEMRDYAERYFRHLPVTFEGEHADDAAEAGRFMGALNQNPHLKALAATPLLLSLICYLYRLEGLPLPAGLSQLFDRATRHMLSAALHRAERFYPEPLKRRVLEAIAFQVTVHHNRLTKFRYEQFNQAAVRMLTAAEAEFGRTDLNTVLEDIVGNSGLLQQLSDGSYAFLHLSFQEYSAAGAIAAWETTRPSPLAPDDVWAFVDRKAWDPDWEPFILFLAGQLPDPIPLLELLADAKKDDYFRHRLALAALCLPELKAEIRSSQSATIDQTTTAAFSLWWQYRLDSTGEAVPHLTRALPALGQVNGRMNGMPLQKWLCQRLSDADKDVRVAALEMVKALGGVAATPEFLAHLAALLGAADWEVRYEAAEAVAALGSAAATPEILARLAALLGDADEDVRWAAVRAVAALGGVAATPEFLARLAALLGDARWDVRRKAVRAVEALDSAAATPEILARLAALLGDARWDVRRKAVRAVEALGSAAATPEILAYVAALLGDADWHMRRAAVSVVQRLMAQGVRIFPTRSGKWEARSVEELSR